MTRPADERVIWTNGAMRLIERMFTPFVGQPYTVITEEALHTGLSQGPDGKWHRMSEVYAGANAIRDMHGKIERLQTVVDDARIRLDDRAERIRELEARVLELQRERDGRIDRDPEELSDDDLCNELCWSRSPEVVGEVRRRLRKNREMARGVPPETLIEWDLDLDLLERLLRHSINEHGPRDVYGYALKAVTECRSHRANSRRIEP